MHKSFLVILLLSQPVWAHSGRPVAETCLRLLTSEQPLPSLAPSPSQRSAAQQWLDALSGSTGQTPEFALEEWRRWGLVNDRQRDAAVGLELDKLTATRSNPVYTINGFERLNELSRDNRARLLRELEEKYPLPKEGFKDPNVLAAADRLAWGIDLHYLRAYEVKREVGVHPPLVSPNELAKRRLRDRGSLGFYSRLVDGSPSVGFTVAVAVRGREPWVGKDAVNLNKELAERYGFFIPEVENARQLVTFFVHHDPDALERLLRGLRYSLPAGISSTPELLQYISVIAPETLFPPDNLYVRMAALRTRLSRFVLNQADGEAFLRLAFKHFLLYAAAQDRSQFDRWIADSQDPRSLQTLFQKDFMSFIGWSAMSLRLPVAVPPSRYSIVRHTTYPDGGPDRYAPGKGPWNSSRLDHDSRP